MNTFTDRWKQLLKKNKSLIHKQLKDLNGNELKQIADDMDFSREELKKLLDKQRKLLGEDITFLEALYSHKQEKEMEKESLTFQEAIGRLDEYDYRDSNPFNDPHYRNYEFDDVEDFLKQFQEEDCKEAYKEFVSNLKTYIEKNSDSLLKDAGIEDFTLNEIDYDESDNIMTLWFFQGDEEFVADVELDINGTYKASDYGRYYAATRIDPEEGGYYEEVWFDADLKGSAIDVLKDAAQNLVSLDQEEVEFHESLERNGKINEAWGRGDTRYSDAREIRAKLEKDFDDAGWGNLTYGDAEGYPTDIVIMAVGNGTAPISSEADCKEFRVYELVDGKRSLLKDMTAHSIEELARRLVNFDALREPQEILDLRFFLRGQDKDAIQAGADRQENIKRLERGDKVILKRAILSSDLRKHADDAGIDYRTAVLVYDEDGNELGFVPSEDSVLICKRLVMGDKGVKRQPTDAHVSFVQQDGIRKRGPNAGKWGPANAAIHVTW